MHPYCTLCTHHMHKAKQTNRNYKKKTCLVNFITKSIMSNIFHNIQYRTFYTFMFWEIIVLVFIGFFCAQTISLRFCAGTTGEQLSMYLSIYLLSQVMRVLCRDYGWTTNGEIVQTPAPGDRYENLLLNSIFTG